MLRSPRSAPASVTLADGEEIAAGIVVVASGVRATPLADALGTPQAPDGRVLVEPNLSIPAHPDVFAIGDMAALPTPDAGLHPALAQFAIQGGRHAAHEIQRQLQGKPPRRFRYWDKGMTSMVGYNAAILQSGRIHLRGGVAFFLWGALHAHYLPGFRNRLSLRVTWIWSWATRRRAALLLIETPTPRERPQILARPDAELIDRSRRSAHEARPIEHLFQREVGHV